MPGDPQANLLSDVSQLYELSLSIGSSLDLQANCDRFLSTLMTRRNFACAAVWWQHAAGQSPEAVYASPALSKTASPNSLAGQLPLGSPRAPTHEEVSDLLGTPRPPTRCMLFPLGQHGALLLGAHRTEAFSPVERGQLRTLLDKFAVSLNGCLAHRSLLEAEARNQQLALVAQHTDNAVVITDRAQRILWTNTGFTTLTGWRSEEVIGQLPGRLLQGPATDPATVAEIRDAIAAHRGITAELLNYHRDGSSYWVSMSINPIVDEAGETNGYIAVERDVSTDREQRERLEQARDLLATQTEALEDARVAAEQASQAKSRFVAEMSHEFRTPLASILGLGDVLSTLIPSDSEPVLAQMRRSANHLLDLVNGVLDLASIEAGRLELDLRPLSLSELLDDVHNVVAPRAESRGLNLQFPGPRETDLELSSDARRIRQILVNLLDNAIKYTDHGSVTLRIRSAPQQLELTVEDTGIGIPTDRLPHLFEPFVRIEGVKSKRDGRGLGLSLAREFARALGGDIRVESTAGSGSRFTLQLPAAMAPQTPAEVTATAASDADLEASAEQRTPQLHGMRVLIAEDTSDLRLILAFYLEKTGATVQFAVDGRQAVNAVAQAEQSGEPFDAVLMDVQMPVLDGLQATAALREGGYRGHITAVTAYAMAEDRERCRSAGCDDWLGKPVDPDALYRLLRQIRGDQSPPS